MAGYSRASDERFRASSKVHRLHRFGPLPGLSVPVRDPSVDPWCPRHPCGHHSLQKGLQATQFLQRCLSFQDDFGHRGLRKYDTITSTISKENVFGDFGGDRVALQGNVRDPDLRTTLFPATCVACGSVALSFCSQHPVRLSARPAGVWRPLP